MKQLINFLLFFFCAVSVAQAGVIYVTPQGSGNGNSWQSATTLVNAMRMARSGDQIWVTAGTYTPTQGTDRTATFLIPSNVALIGGFAGNESQAQQRDHVRNRSILSGDIGRTGHANDNVYTVAYLENGNGVTLDGFVFSGGFARDYSEALQPSTCGGGLFINGGQPTILNCTFTANQARNGAAVFVNGQGRTTIPVFQNCQFVNNQADFKGGAVYNNGRDGVASPRFQFCAFESNKSDYGAGMFNNGTRGESAPLVLGCSFINNYALSTGAVIFNFLKGDQGTVNPILKDCEMVGNDSVLHQDVAQNRHTAALDNAVLPTGGTRSPNATNR